MARIDFAPYGENPPHTHPRATEILTVIEGTLYVGFVLSNQNNNTLITKVLNKGDVFVFPIGLIHFQANIGHTPAIAIAALSSQNPGVITIANSVFGSNLPISDKILAKAFQVDNKARLAIEDLDEAPVLGVVAGAAEIGGEERVVDEAEGVEGDGVLGEEGEEGIHQVVEESNGEEAVGSGEEAVGGRDKHRGGALGAFPSDESALEDASGGAESGGGVGVDVDAVEVVLAMEEELSKRGEGLTL
ncbi:hypothetical protein AAC387_Pa05g3505 [Persea americana]